MQRWNTYYQHVWRNRCGCATDAYVKVSVPASPASSMTTYVDSSLNSSTGRYQIVNFDLISIVLLIRYLNVGPTHLNIGQEKSYLKLRYRLNHNFN